MNAAEQILYTLQDIVKREWHTLPKEERWEQLGYSLREGKMYIRTNYPTYSIVEVTVKVLVKYN